MEKISDKQNHTFQKSKPYEISSTDLYICGNQELIFHVFYWFIHQAMKSILNVKRGSNLIKGRSSHNICSGIKIQQVKKPICHSVPRTLNFFSEFFCSISSSHFRSFNFICAFNRETK